MKSNIQTDCLPSNYVPCDNEEYMNKRQLRYFENKLLTQQKELKDRIQASMKKLKTLRSESSDILDKSHFEDAIFHELRIVERNNLRLQLNEKALSRIENGYFGYCIITGEAIGIKRLNLIPSTAMSMGAMRLFEKNNTMEHHSGDMAYSLAS